LCPASSAGQAPSAQDPDRKRFVDGAFRDWLPRQPADNVIVSRQDRYAAAICSLGDLEQVTGKLRQILG
jgi:hypothetical protein